MIRVYKGIRLTLKFTKKITQIISIDWKVSLLLLKSQKNVFVSSSKSFLWVRFTLYNQLCLRPNRLSLFVTPHNRLLGLIIDYNDSLENLPFLLNNRICHWLNGLRAFKSE